MLGSLCIVGGIMLEYDITITDKELYDYMMAHSYNSASGILGSCLGALMVVIAIDAEKCSEEKKADKKAAKKEK